MAGSTIRKQGSSKMIQRRELPCILSKSKTAKCGLNYRKTLPETTSGTSFHSTPCAAALPPDDRCQVLLGDLPSSRETVCDYCRRHPAAIARAVPAPHSDRTSAE